MTSASVVRIIAAMEQALLEPPRDDVAKLMQAEFGIDRAASEYLAAIGM